MNSTESAIEFLLNNFFIESEEWTLAEQFLQTTPFGHFVGEGYSQKKVLSILEGQIEGKFGPTAVKKRQGHDNRLSFRLDFLVDITEGRWVGLWRSKDLTIHEIQEIPSGSKVVFTRSSSTLGHGPGLYSHTGILLRIDGIEFVAEVQKVNRKVRTILTRWDLIPDFGERTYVDNMYLKQAEVRLNDVLYRLSRIHYLPLQYNTT